MKISRGFQSLLFMALLLTVNVNAQLTSGSGGGEANPNLKTNVEALQKFQNNRFGMFIHWGPVALRGGEISWSRERNIPAKDYDTLYKDFNPVLFNAEEWVNTAKNAGMKYMVLTARHHDGFSLWDSKYSDYDMANTPYGKGVVKSLSDECKKQGMDFGIYYSILDWWHTDYPITRTKTAYDKKYTGPPAPEVKAGIKRYHTYIKNQLKELIDLTDPSMIWFDGEWEWPWTHEMGMDMYAYLRGLNDDLLINNRVDKGRNGFAGTTKSNKFAGDYGTPEQEVGKFDNKNAWETCMTIGKQWAWRPNDKLKSEKECIQTLLKTIGGDGNLLFNVGPMADGRIEKRQIDRLKKIGDWLKVNGEAVYGTRGGPYLPTDYMVSSRNKNKIYIHLFEEPKTGLKLPLPKGIKIKQAYFLDGKKAVHFTQKKNFFEVDLPKHLPNKTASVLVLEINKPAKDIAVIKRVNY